MASGLFVIAAAALRPPACNMPAIRISFQPPDAAIVNLIPGAGKAALGRIAAARIDIFASSVRSSDNRYDDATI